MFAVSVPKSSFISGEGADQVVAVCVMKEWR